MSRRFKLPIRHGPIRPPLARTTIVTVEGRAPWLADAQRMYLKSFDKARLLHREIEATKMPDIYQRDDCGWFSIVNKFEVTSQISPKTRALLEARNIRV